MPPTTEDAPSHLARKIIEALQYLGGTAHVQQIRKVITAHTPCSPSGVRCTLQHHCATSPQYRHRFDLFRPVSERGQGCWRLLDYTPAAPEITIVMKPHELARLLSGDRVCFDRGIATVSIALRQPDEDQPENCDK